MARLVTPPPESTPAEWGKRLAYLACVLIPVLLLVTLLLREKQTSDARVGWDAVTLSTTPPMPTADFLREVRAAGRLGDKLDLHDAEILQRLYQACSQHEWVEQVTRVALTGPKTLLINLTFRTPVAQLTRGSQVQLIDRYGKLLLPLQSSPTKPLVTLVGWDDRLPEAMAWLAQAGQLAADLQPDLANWKIAGIYLHRDAPLDLADLRLKTESGTYIIWQTLKGPAQEEPSLVEKQSRLRVYLERYGNLDAPSGQLLDVRVKEGLQRKPMQ